MRVALLLVRGKRTPPATSPFQSRREPSLERTFVACPDDGRSAKVAREANFVKTR